MEEGTALQNNYSTAWLEGAAHTAGGLQLVQGVTFVMNGGIIQKCYITGSGGGIQTKEGSRFTSTSGAVRKYHGILGSAIQAMKSEGILLLGIRDCASIRNPPAGYSHH